MFDKKDGFVGIDLDHCRDSESEQIEPWALEIIEAVKSYTEITPSGTGIHIIARGELPEGQRRKGNIEMYDSGRYFTMTSNHLPDTPTQPRTRSLNKVWQRYLCNQSIDSSEISAENGLTASDRELIEKAMAAENGEKFQALWEGDHSSYPSQSEADMALCRILSFWTQKDAALINRLFRNSGLY